MASSSLITYQTFWFIMKKTQNNFLPLPVATISFPGGLIPGIPFEKQVKQQD
jgi:hypothetical protein